MHAVGRDKIELARIGVEQVMTGRNSRQRAFDLRNEPGIFGDAGQVCLGIGHRAEIVGSHASASMGSAAPSLNGRSWRPDWAVDKSSGSAPCCFSNSVMASLLKPVRRGSARQRQRRGFRSVGSFARASR